MTEIDNIEKWIRALNTFYEFVDALNLDVFNDTLSNISLKSKSLREKFEEDVFTALDNEKKPEVFLKELRRKLYSVCNNYIYWYEKNKPKREYYKRMVRRVEETQTFLNSLKIEKVLTLPQPTKRGADYAAIHYEQLKEKLKITDNPTKAVRMFDSTLDENEVKAVSKKFRSLLTRDNHKHPWRTL